MSISIKFKKEDIWIGVYLQSVFCGGCGKRYYDWYICLIPMFPIHIEYHRCAHNG